MDKYTQIGRFLSLVLRHRPEKIGIELDENGWADVSLLIAGLNKAKHKIDMDILEEIVSTNNKKRYSFNSDKSKIRANQGHSIDVDVELKPTNPPDTLYHGTADKFYESIMQEGLKKQNRNHVHLSFDKETAITVGRRHGKPIIFAIKASNMQALGYVFYLSENGVWLTDNIPVEYIELC